jgi:hypothetical protein
MIIGVNTFLSSAPSPKRLWRLGDKGSPTILPKAASPRPSGKVIRAK